MLPALLATVLLGAAQERPSPGGYLSPAGILTEDRTAIFVEADTELALWPAFFVGLRRGMWGVLDLGIEGGGLDVLAVVRGHIKAELWTSGDGAWSICPRLRVQHRRQLQEFPDGTKVDDLSVDVIPELGVGYRFGEDQRHALYYAAFYFADVDLRPGYPVQHFVMVAMLGYEHRFDNGVHVQADAALGFELANPATEGIPIPRLRVRLGYDL